MKIMENSMATECFTPIVKYHSAAQFSLPEMLGTVGSGVYAFFLAQHPVEEKTFVTANSDRSIAVLDLEVGKAVRVFNEHSDRVNQVCFTKINSDPELVNVFLSASEDGLVKIWDTKSPSSVSTLKLGKTLYCIDCNGKYLMTGSDQTVFMYDIKSLKQFKKLKSHSDEVMGVTSHPLYKHLWLSCGPDELLCSYDLSQDDVLDSTIRSEQPLDQCGYIGESRDSFFAVTGTNSIELYPDMAPVQSISAEKMGHSELKVLHVQSLSSPSRLGVYATNLDGIYLSSINPANGAVRQEGIWRDVAAGSDILPVLRACVPMKNSNLVVSDDGGNIKIGHQISTVTKFQMDREKMQVKEGSIPGPIRDFQQAKKRYRPSFIQQKNNL